MFLSHRYNPFEELDRTFNSFWDDDSDEYTDFFSTIRVPRTKRISKEEKLKKKLNKLHNQENEINHYIKQYESQIEQLKKNKQQVEKKRSDISNKITQIAEEKKKQLETNQNQKSGNNDNQKSENRIFKKVHYISDGMEIEEQYDSTNPKNCYKIIRKQGETPQIISGEQQQAQIQQNKTEEQQQQKRQKLGNGLDEKLDQLCKMSGKPASELENFVIENKDLTIGQLYDKANELKLI
ncbi:hypothetical protein TTHERM_00476930 (macronuclear) [Tetrahymena thermophila SB210]|uniref:Uncharacterized protein n=1 Tax=Tetrahymena thermophila (strain SB210) TaxID=312017 RepID=I7MJS9_TETTS|nr:hypothetical protein TTHERM_00476930 [Tetrahymena thermophila SB210]EAR97155.1 hypothetical protein TTHERM_00476930 [Tetrahymena thermophila SB210]|eukprot:XP_001017400.1 hypothetical protein TTHERM_00476930 [Tetrahymena thermophila SB210]